MNSCGLVIRRWNAASTWFEVWILWITHWKPIWGDQTRLNTFDTLEKVGREGVCPKLRTLKHLNTILGSLFVGKQPSVTRNSLSCRRSTIKDIPCFYETQSSLPSAQNSLLYITLNQFKPFHLTYKRLGLPIGLIPLLIPRNIFLFLKIYEHSFIYANDAFEVNNTISSV